MSVFAVLLVSSGNQCRSPAAAVVLRSFFASLSGDADASVDAASGTVFETASAGTAVPLPTAAVAVAHQGEGAHRAVGAVGRGTSSAGLLGRPMHPLTAQALTSAGFVVPSHVAQPLTPDIVGAADLVLTAERRHRAAVVEADPVGAAARHTFTMLEFARVASSLAEGFDALSAPLSPAELVAQVAAARVEAPATADDDIPDPASLPFAAHEEMVDVIARAVRAVADVLVKP